MQGLEEPRNLPLGHSECPEVLPLELSAIAALFLPSEALAVLVPVLSLQGVPWVAEEILPQASGG